jgi:hypothetical protein
MLVPAVERILERRLMTLQRAKHGPLCKVVQKRFAIDSRPLNVLRIELLRVNSKMPITLLPRMRIEPEGFGILVYGTLGLVGYTLREVGVDLDSNVKHCVWVAG